MMVSSSIVRAKESSKEVNSQARHSRHPENFLATRSRSSSSSSVSISRNDFGSVPSLFEAAVVAIPPPPPSNHDSRLAFTTEDLQLTPKFSSSSRASGGGDSSGTVGFYHPIVPSPLPGSMKANKKKFMRHGLLLPTTSDLLDSMNTFQDPGHIGPADFQKDSLINSNATLSGDISSLQLRARPTVTTILRQKHVLEKAEKKERDKLETLMVSNAAGLEVDNLCREQERRDTEVAKAAEAKRLLQARLAYEKAIAASRKVTDEKQKIAESTRQKEKEWKSLLEKQRESDRERRKAMTESLQRATNDSKRAFDEMLHAKQVRANRVKKETERLQAEARLKQHQDDIKRHDKIQQIQAAKLALKRTKETMGNPNQFYRSIAIPETQIKLRLQKEEEKRKLQETRQKIQAAKQMKSVKLIRAMKKIQSCECVARKQHLQDQILPKNERPASVQQMYTNRPFSFPDRSSTASQFTRRDTDNNIIDQPIITNNNNVAKDAEMSAMLEQLKQLRTENYQKRVNEQKQRAQAVASHMTTNKSTVKVIGDNNNNRNKKSAGVEPLTKYYPHRSHYGIHV